MPVAVVLVPAPPAPRIARADGVGDHDGLALGEDAGLGRAHARHVADGVHAGERRLEGERVDRDPAVDGQPGLLHDGRRPVHRDAEEQVVGHLAAVAEHGDLAVGVERAHEALGVPVDAALGEGREQRLPTPRATAGWARGSGITSAISERSRQPALASGSRACSSAVSLGAGGHLNGVDVTATITRPPSKSASTSRRAKAPGHRVELVPPSTRPGVALGVQVGAERHHEDVGVEGPGVGLDPLGDGVDRLARWPGRTARPASRGRVGVVRPPRPAPGRT